MINQVIDLTGLIISIFGMIQVWQSRILERRSCRYFLGIFSILIAYAVFDLISWQTHGIPGRGWLLASKGCLFLESFFSCALIPLLSGLLLYTSGEGKARANRIFQINIALFTANFILLVYTQFSRCML